MTKLLAGVVAILMAQSIVAAADNGRTFDQLTTQYDASQAAIAGARADAKSQEVKAEILRQIQLMAQQQGGLAGPVSIPLEYDKTYHRFSTDKANSEFTTKSGLACEVGLKPFWCGNDFSNCGRADVKLGWAQCRSEQGGEAYLVDRNLNITHRWVTCPNGWAFDYTGDGYGTFTTTTKARLMVRLGIPLEGKYPLRLYNPGTQQAVSDLLYCSMPESTF